MILVDGDKYACVQCIRGHRSSTCKHTLRPLVQVRGRGRPSLNAGHRIAVTESELVMEKDQVTFQADLDKQGQAKAKTDVSHPSCCGNKKSTPVVDKKSCCASTGACNCDGNGVIILKASKRQFVDVKGGNLDYVGEYNEQSMKRFRVGMNAANQRRLEQHTPSSSCHIGQANLRPLKTLQVNEIEAQIPLQLLKIEPKLEFELQHQRGFELDARSFSYPNTVDTKVSDISSGRFYDVFKSEGCADECDCGAECACPGCLVHRSNEELRAYGLLESSTTASTPNDYNETRKEVRVHSPESHHPLQFINFQTMNEVDFQGLLDGGCVCPAESCACHNCLKHGILNGVRQSDHLQVSSTPPPLQSLEHDPYELDEHDCGCSPEECECFNCTKHGRLEGMRINM